MELATAIFYHIYPLGALGVLDGTRRGDWSASGGAPLARIAKWIPNMKRLGVNALYLGPVFESERHGYDTVDHLRVDGRLGANEDLVDLSGALREQGIALVLDAVFNHVGRSHPLVKDVIEKGSASSYASWIAGFDPSRSGPGGLPFAYEGWAGNYDLVKLDTGLHAVAEHLIAVALEWIDAYGVAGLRLDAADCLDRGFLRELGLRCRERLPGFVLIGEAVQGNSYAGLLADGLDLVTNFEAFKGLWSSCNDRNFHEIGWTLERLFGIDGLCKGKMLYNFADNHDVDRVASTLQDPRCLYPLYGLLFAMPGVPSLYYGSEYGIAGRKVGGDDGPLRPCLDPGELAATAVHPDLALAIARFSQARQASKAVREGTLAVLQVQAQGIAILRRSHGDAALVAVNASASSMRFACRVPELSNHELTDLLDPSYRIRLGATGAAEIEVPSHWLRWLVPLA